MSEGRLYDVPSTYVTVYCAARSHAGEPWIIATYTPAWDSQGNGYWAYSRDQYLAGQFMRRSSRRHNTMREVGGPDHSSLRRLDESTTPTASDPTVFARSNGVYFVSDRLRCHLCGYNVKRTSANLKADLDRFAAEGRFDVPVQELR